MLVLSASEPPPPERLLSKTRLADKLSFPFCGALGGHFEGHLGASWADLGPKTYSILGSEVL
jgi:hypothetical protein